MIPKITDNITDWRPHTDPLRWPDDRFDALAARLFRHQYDHNTPYRTLCDRRGVDPSSIAGYRDIPAVATEVFKQTDISCEGPVTRTLRTSGTTVGQRGAHRFETLEVYRAALHPTFERFCLPDQQIEAYRMLVVAPGPDALPDSSLSYMLGELVDRWGDEESRFFARPGDDGELTFDFTGLAEALDRAGRADQPTFVLATAFGLAEFFAATDRDWSLGEDARVMETGGFKGKTRELTKADFYDQIDDRLGVPSERVIGEYSMTELSSQAYTANLLEGPSAPNAPVERAFYPPPWARIEVVDPASLEVITEPGARGLIRWYDLANVGSVCAIQTSDIGRTTDDGGLVLGGRAPQADLRGCSLTAEEIAG